MKNRVYLLLVLLGGIQLSSAQHKVFFEILPGAAYVLPSKLLIHQEGYDDIILKAHYEVQPFTLPPYYSLRAGVSLNSSTSVELELNHLKLWLLNPPPEITRFSITHGYNQLWLNLLKKYRYFDLRVGAGPVIAHAENIIRGLRLDQTGGLFNNGYHLDGITTQLSIQKQYFITNFLYLMGESKMNVSWSRTDVVNGYANVSVYAVHLLGGVGVVF